MAREGIIYLVLIYHRTRTNTTSFTDCILCCVCAEMKAIRLTGGLDRCSGIVEIHRNGSWGTVCDNCWFEKEASMVCSMLQCGAKPQKISQFDPPLKHNNGALYYYQCFKDEQSLWQCLEYINLPHLCKDSKASGVICNGE